MISQSVLDQGRWDNVRVGSVIVSFCETCGCQRVHSCVDSYWKDGERFFVFLCDFCRFNSGGKG